MESPDNDKWNDLIDHPTYTLTIGDIKITIPNGVFTPDSTKTHSSAIILNNFPDVADKAVLDVGSGTGLLAIQAAKRGASDVAATDISPKAVRTIQENARQNNASEINVLKTNLADGVDMKFDVILANLPIEGSLWELDQKDLMSEFFASIANNWKPNTEVFIPWGSFKEEERGYIESVFTKNGWSYEVIKEQALGYTWYLYKLSRT